MKRYIFIGFFSLTMLQCIFGQTDSLSIYSLYDAIDAHYPSAHQIPALHESNEFKINAIQSGLYPRLSVNGQATYQSDVIEFGPGIDIPGEGISFPTPPRDQYKISLDVNQVVYDGGIIKYKKKYENTGHELSVREVEKELFSIKKQVNDLYFYVMILDKNRELLQVSLNTITERKEQVEAGINNGIFIKSDMESLMAEELNIIQEISDIKAEKEVLVTIIEDYTGMDIGKETSFILPDVALDTISKIQRLENELFVIQQEQLAVAGDLKKALIRPHFFAFGQAGYGNPGLKMVMDEFDTYYIIGAGMKWDLWDWQANKNERQALEVQQRIIDYRQEAFKTNIKIALARELSEYYQLKSKIESEKKIVELRSKIARSAKSRLDNGVITSAEFISKINEETRSKIELENAKIMLVNKVVNYQTLKGIMFN